MPTRIRTRATRMTDHASALAALQQADSFFPGGAMAFSWGLEALRRDALVVDARTLAAFVRTQALRRWATFDQGIVCAAWRAGDDLDAWREADALCEAMTLPEPLRSGSRRLGRTLADVHARLGLDAARRLRDALAERASPGHLPAVQGSVWRALGIGLDDARAVSAHTVCTGAVSAAVRLGLVGHLDAQRVLASLRAPLADVLSRDAPEPAALSSTTFAADIAALRHAAHDARLFAN